MTTTERKPGYVRCAGCGGWKSREAEMCRPCRVDMFARIANVTDPELYVCGRCPLGDNEWPASSFTRAGNGRLAGGKRLCNDCWERAYPDQHRTCTVCGRSHQTRSIKAPYVCRDCYYPWGTSCA